MCVRCTWPATRKRTGRPGRSGRSSRSFAVFSSKLGSRSPLGRPLSSDQLSVRQVSDNAQQQNNEHDKPKWDLDLLTVKPKYPPRQVRHYSSPSLYLMLSTRSGPSPMPLHCLEPSEASHVAPHSHPCNQRIHSCATVEGHLRRLPQNHHRSAAATHLTSDQIDQAGSRTTRRRDFSPAIFGECSPGAGYRVIGPMPLPEYIADLLYRGPLVAGDGW